MTQDTAAVHACGLELHTRRGAVYPATSFIAAKGAVTALLGPARSGRTALLLTLAGRMRPSAGTARVCGRSVTSERRLVRRSVGLGLVAGVNDLDDALTAAEHISERRLFLGVRDRLGPGALLERVDLSSARDTRVGDLDTEDCMRLGIALALVGDPQLIAIDDIDHDLELEQQAAIVNLLRDIAVSGTSVLFTCVDERTAALADATVVLPARPTHEGVRSDAVA